MQPIKRVTFAIRMMMHRISTRIIRQLEQG